MWLFRIVHIWDNLRYPLAPSCMQCVPKSAHAALYGPDAAAQPHLLLQPCCVDLALKAVLLNESFEPLKLGGAQRSLAATSYLP